MLPTIPDTTVPDGRTINPKRSEFLSDGPVEGYGAVVSSGSKHATRMSLFVTINSSLRTTVTIPAMAFPPIAIEHPTAAIRASADMRFIV